MYGLPEFKNTHNPNKIFFLKRLGCCKVLEFNSEKSELLNNLRPESTLAVAAGSGKPPTAHRGDNLWPSVIFLSI